MTQYKRALVGLGVGAVLAASFVGSASAQSPAASAAASGLTVGVSWNNFQEERWGLWDEPAIKKALDAAGAKYISTDAASSAEQQLTDVENLISQGANAIIILAQDGTAIQPAVQKALDAGIPVVAYDRLIEVPGVEYITFDNKLVGHLQAQAVFDKVPKGNYAIIKGNQADANADFLRSGMEEVIGDAVKAGDIKIVCETYTDDWKPANAQNEMEQCLTANSNAIDAVLSENDGMAGGVIAALQAQGLTVPVSGQDGDKAALNRVALGTQTVDVWKDARLLGDAAAKAALAMAGGTTPDKVDGSVQFTTPGGNTLSSIFLTPDPITQANLSDVVDAGWITTDELCQGVTPGSVPACPAS
ncbi:MAG: substrate-binding domain-containing protein [Chloroflexota bacterium]